MKKKLMFMRVTHPGSFVMVDESTRGMPAALLKAFNAIPPEHVIGKNGIEYIRIYRVDSLPQAVKQPDPVLPAVP